MKNLSNFHLSQVALSLLKKGLLLPLLVLLTFGFAQSGTSQPLPEYIVWDFPAPTCDDAGNLTLHTNFFGLNLDPALADPDCSFPVDFYSNPQFQYTGHYLQISIIDHQTGNLLIKLDLYFSGKIVLNGNGVPVWEIECANEGIIWNFNNAPVPFDCSRIQIVPGNASNVLYPIPANTPGISTINITIPYNDPFFATYLGNATSIDIESAAHLEHTGFQPFTECHTNTNILFNTGTSWHSYLHGTHETYMPVYPGHQDWTVVEDFQLCQPHPLDCENTCGGDFNITYTHADNPNAIIFHFDGTLCPGTVVNSSYWRMGDGNVRYTSTPYSSACDGIYNAYPHPEDGNLCYTYSGPGTYWVKAKFLLVGPMGNLCFVEEMLMVTVGGTGERENYIDVNPFTLNKDDKATGNHLEINPNPVESKLNIKYTASMSQSIDVSVFTADGKRVISQKIQVEKGVNTFNFDLENLPAGVYFISGFDSVKKFVKK
ncbi:MAG: T9SS type A sorting domain-containing protein [Saprospiraceae bacterium]|nr:T9SS type A sorting domain-containing protein [Saprospiraceae bacterium]